MVAGLPHKRVEPCVAFTTARLSLVFCFVTLSIVSATWIRPQSNRSSRSVETPKLIVVPSGRLGIRQRIAEQQLHNNADICLGQYRHGFSIRCDGDGRKATFYVNGKVVQKQFRAPFHIAGHRGRNIIAPWVSYPSRGVITCVLDNGTKVSAGLDSAEGKYPRVVKEEILN
ncbi:hypothetical protein BWQ96_03025 [Gracilariopsis chorda]|uniref:Uncharacterized protein n=1 Tax=Gracilariopsis chorda TaxID=448386 RepID=A0A2V3J1I2_9FLOR|nr:hypothetical protein BWQ96_03025 [Gracilariopsis chorda]|eukprot:PXF47250.1 hypothetical protein BWQ96_03025 [Gracilariopsis chorda]